MAMAAKSNGEHLRLVWPQWQGGGTPSVRELAGEFPFPEARRGYAMGAQVLQAVLPEHDGPTEMAPVDMSDAGTETRDGIEAKDAILTQLKAALEVIGRHRPERITTLGGECSVSVAPFAALAATHGSDLAVIWIDSHPDVGTGASDYPGYHAMAVSVLTGNGDPEAVALLPATVPPERVALVGLHAWTQDDFPNIAAWGLTSLSPEDLRDSSEGLLAWLRETGCTKVAVHFDVDTIDSNEIVLGLGAEPNGLTSAQVDRIVADLGREAEVVGLTIAEFIPRQVMHVAGIVGGWPLIGRA